MSETVEYIINDPICPIKVSAEMPADPTPKIIVSGEPARNTFITVATSINSRQKAFSRVREPLTRWAATNRLTVYPRAGQDLNAYYDRASLRFFYYPVGNRIIYTVDSTDVVTHELGHALLDALRPDFWSVQALEIWAFHEAFADINAMMAIMDYQPALEEALRATGGNLRNSNIISRLAEEVGAVLYGKRHLYLRDAVNDFKYENPETLPDDSADEQLSAECHSFGRVFLGAWWEMMVAMYEQEKNRIDPISALTIAKNVAAEYLYKAIVNSPRVAQYHYAIARGMLAADEENGSKYQAVMKQALTNRNMMPPAIRTMSQDVKLDKLRIKKKDIVQKHGKTTSVIIRSSKAIQLTDKSLKAMNVGGVNLGDLKVEIPADEYYEFDDGGNLIHHLVPEQDMIIEHSRRCASIIASRSAIGRGKMWRSRRGKLVRGFIE